MDKMDLKFAIVLFSNYESKTKKKVIDLVPNSWLVREKTWKCFYPPPHVKNVMELVKKETKPSSSWKKYKIEIIKHASDHDQGLRRLKRACSAAHIESTQSENSEDEKVDSSKSHESINQMEISDSCSTISTPQTLQREMKKDDNNSIISTSQKSSTKCNVLKRKIGSALQTLKIAIVKKNINGDVQSIISAVISAILPVTHYISEWTNFTTTLINFTKNFRKT